MFQEVHKEVLLQPRRRSPLLRFLSACIFWTLVVLFYASTSAGRGRHDWFVSFKNAAAQWYVWALLSPLIFYFDRVLLARREALIQRLLFHIPLSLLFTAAYAYLNAQATFFFLRGRLPDFRISRQELIGEIYWNLPVYGVIVGVYLAFEYQSRLKDRRLRTVELERLLSEAQLDTLRAQLHPHFLFNALNTISAHVEHDPRIARRMIEQLGDLLRLSLKHAEDQEITVQNEIAFLDRYLGLQKARFEDRLDIILKIDPSVLEALVPTFILQPLVENSIHHGISTRLERSVVEVHAWREGDRLRLRVRDDGPGLPENWSMERDMGVGLSNTRARLSHLYGDTGQKLEISGSAGGGVRVDIELPFHALETTFDLEPTRNEDIESAHR